MKKRLALLLAAAMVLSTVPSTAFAGSDNRISRVAIVKVDEDITDTKLYIENADNDWSGQQKFVLSLENAKWNTMSKSDIKVNGKAAIGENTNIEPLSDTEIVVTLGQLDAKDGAVISINLKAEATDEGDIKVTVDPRDSEISSGTYTFAKATNGSTVTTIEKKVDITESAGTSAELKAIVIDETVVNTIDETGTIKLRLGGEFKFVPSVDDRTEGRTVESVTDVGGRITASKANFEYADDNETVEIKLNDAKGDKRSKLSIKGLKVVATDDAEVGDVAEITVSGADIDKTTLEVGTFVQYGISFTVEDKELPVIYSGAKSSDNTETLEVTIKENVADSWLLNRKAEIHFPEEVRINDVMVEDSDKLTDNEDGFDPTADNKNVLDLKDVVTAIDETAKSEITLKFNVSVEAGFTGDITATLTGSGIGEDQTVTVAKAEMPFTVETKANELKIDYRNTPINDIVIKEAYAGAFGRDKVLYLEAENMEFEDGFEYEVVAGDLKVDKIKADHGKLAITIEKPSIKTPAEIKISNLSLYMGRSLAAGDYKLSVVKGSNNNLNGAENEANEDAFFQNYHSTDNTYVAGKAETICFDTDEVVLMKDFVKVITAGRDQDDATFTKQLKVTIGAETMTAGKDEINLNGAVAYISEDNYTMLPVRAVTEALSDVATVTWDNASRRVTIIFGSRIIGMTIGSNIMTINGTQVPMSSQAVIKNDWTYIPLRDLGYALGLGDDKIQWDDATKTATLN